MIADHQIISGEMHYPRIPPEYWSARFDAARAMGLNTISTYVFWNLHEEQPREYDFRDGKDVAAYVRLAAAAGLDVILRPGPYVCAEWEFGGLPAWLLADGGMRVRSTDGRYMSAVRRWLNRLGDELAPLLRTRGGPIVALQLENEYGAFGDDKAYLEALRCALADAGFSGVPYYTIDQPDHAARGSLDTLPIAITFGPGDPAACFAALQAARPGAPLLCGEYWAGWFDYWGEPHQRDDAEQQARDLAWMLDAGASVNVYMFCGGTNFGYWNGANSSDSHPYQPVTTSYDYLAALDEAGRPTAKYHAFRNVIAEHTGMVLPDVPRVRAPQPVAPFVLSQCAPLREALDKPITATRPLAMEEFGQATGYVLYQTTLRAAHSGELSVAGLRDYALVSVNGEVVGTLDRRLGQIALVIHHAAEGTMLELLVENCGRINYGPDFPFERKGIILPVYWNGEELEDWSVYPLALRRPPVLRFASEPYDGPAFYRSTLQTDEPADTFIDVGSLGKGSLWINGWHAGRFWNIGPQRSLYVPAPRLKPGANDVVVFDMMPAFGAELRGTSEPIW
jgi:beta-galactosidase